MRHTKAVRYNDKSVLENHHCAIAFKLLLDPQNDVFELLSEAQYWNVRQIIIKMILSSDISNHFEQISKSSLHLLMCVFNPIACDFSDIQEPYRVQEVPGGYYGGQAADHEHGYVLLRPRCTHKDLHHVLQVDVRRNGGILSTRRPRAQA